MLTKGFRQIQLEVWLSCIALLFTSLTALNAQATEKNYSLVLKTGTFEPEVSTAWSPEKRAVYNRSCFQDTWYLILQFNTIPNKQEHASIEAQGIELLEYIPNNAYLAAVPADITDNQLSGLNIRTAFPFDETYKIAPELQDSPEGSIEVILHLHKNIKVTQVHNQLPLTAQITNTAPLQVRVDKAQINDLSALPFVKYITPTIAAPELLGTRSKSVRGKYLNSPAMGGLKGQDVIIGIGDGGLGAHIDFTGRYISNINGSGDNTLDHPHANMVAGMLGGSGILNSRIKGVAPKSTIIFDYASQALLDPVVDNNVASGMVLTNNSYGSGEGGAYNLDSERCDNQLRRHPQLMHVFSAGNSGKVRQPDFPTGYNTILTSGQSAKNAISVAGVNHYNELYLSSSRGPTLDGRIKPEITAISYGFAAPTENNNYQNGYGTSFASPQVAGGLALLYEHYRNLHGDSNPDAALMKAIVCNTAEDLGNPGPDYTYGYGKLNLRRAKKTLDDASYFSGTLEHNDIINFDIDVPANVHELKVMLYWADTSASSIAGKDLVNDLDLSIIRPGDIRLPYILNPDAPTDNAYPGADHSNNIEQVVVSNPPPGNYPVKVFAHNVAYASQKFHVVYEFVQSGITLTSPLPDELIPGGGSTNYYIEWDYYGDDNNTFTIEYSPDEGSNWITLNDSIDSELRVYRWKKSELIDLNTSEALIKISRNNTTHLDVIQSPFKAYNFISRQDFSLTPLCDDDILFEWPASNGASAYELLQYDGNTEMGVIASTADNSFVLQYPYSNGDAWFAIQVVYPNGVRSVRSDAKLFTPPSGNSPNSCPPSRPPGLSYTTGQYHIQFSWEEAMDDGGVTGYNIYENGTLLETVNELNYMIHYTQSGVGTTYCISAVDANGNESPTSCFYTATFVENSCNQDVLLVTNESEPSDAELLIVNQLQSTDYHIFTIGSDEVSNYLWDKNWMVVISPEAVINPNDLPLFDDVPLIIMNIEMLDDFNLAASITPIISKNLELLSPYHPVSATMSGTFPFYSNEYFMEGAGTLPPGATPIVRFGNDFNLLFVYEPGYEMLNGLIAQEKRVAYPIQPNHIEHLSTQARTLIESSLAWTAGCIIDQPQSPINLVATPNFTSIELNWDFLVGTGGNNAQNYAIYLDDILMGTTANTSYIINGLPSSTPYRVSVSALNSYYIESGRIHTTTATLTCKEFEIYLYLEGALDPQLSPDSTNIQMSSILNQRGLLPGQSGTSDNQSTAGHPYYNPPWNYLNFENIETYNADIVDWVLISFRTDIDKSSEVYQLTGLLLKDGSVHFPRSCIDYEFTDSVYIVAEHRNHLGIMSVEPVAMNDNRIFYDFRYQDSYNVAAFGQKELIPGIFAMYAGDGNQENDIGGYEINGVDKAPWEIMNGSFSLYSPEDFNLDGDINGADKSLWFINNGIYSSVPK